MGSTVIVARHKYTHTHTRNEVGKAHSRRMNTSPKSRKCRNWNIPATICTKQSKELQMKSKGENAARTHLINRTLNRDWKINEPARKRRNGMCLCLFFILSASTERIGIVAWLGHFFYHLYYLLWWHIRYEYWQSRNEKLVAGGSNCIFTWSE